MNHQPNILARLALILAAALVPSLSSATGVVIAAVPLRWTVETSRAQPAVFEAYHGESLDLAATLQSYGKPVEIDPQADWKIYWQTNGMADAWWSAPATVAEEVPGVTSRRGVVTATFTPAMDPGTSSVNGFLGSPGNNYRAAFTIRFRHAPGSVPNEIPLPVKAINFSEIQVENAPYFTRQETGEKISAEIGKIRTVVSNLESSLCEKISQVEADATNTAAKVKQGGFRHVTDDYVYEPLGSGPFTWRCDREGFVAALGSRQPYVDWDYEDGYADWSIWGDWDNAYFWGYAYAKLNATQITFDCEYDYWDEDTGYWTYDNIILIASRPATDWKLQEPLDTYARQSDLERTRREFETIRDTIYMVETKVMRSDRPSEYGSGYGYLRKPLDSDFRSWRIRAPRCTITGLDMKTYTTTPIYTFDGGSTPYTSLANPLSCVTDYAKTNLTLERTSGVYGSDSVELADFSLGLIRKSPANEDAGHYVRYKIKNVSRSPLSFELTPVLDSFDIETITVNGRQIKNLARVPVTLPEVHGINCNSDGRSAYLNSAIKEIYISTNSVRFTNSCRIDLHVKTKDWQSSDEDGGGTRYWEVDNAYHVVPVTITFTTYQLADYYLPAGRVITDHCAGYFYDDAQKATYRVKCENGCFYTEFVKDKDWRKEDF